MKKSKSILAKILVASVFAMQGALSNAQPGPSARLCLHSHFHLALCPDWQPYLLVQLKHFVLPSETVGRMLLPSQQLQLRDKFETSYYMFIHIVRFCHDTNLDSNLIHFRSLLYISPFDYITTSRSHFLICIYNIPDIQTLIID